MINLAINKFRSSRVPACRHPRGASLSAQVLTIMPEMIFLNARDYKWPIDFLFVVHNCHSNSLLFTMTIMVTTITMVTMVITITMVIMFQHKLTANPGDR